MFTWLNARHIVIGYESQMLTAQATRIANGTLQGQLDVQAAITAARLE